MRMLALKCPQCGADVEMDETREFGFCTFCGTKVMRDKIVIEHTGGIRIENGKDFDNLITLARREYEYGNEEKSAEYYDAALLLNPNSWEAVFYSSGFIRGFEHGRERSRINRKETMKMLSTVWHLIKELPYDEQKSAFDEIISHLNKALENYNYYDIRNRLNRSKSWLKKEMDSRKETWGDCSYAEELNSRDISRINEDYFMDIKKSVINRLELGDDINEILGDAYSDTFVKYWKDALNVVSESNSYSIFTESIEIRPEEKPVEIRLEEYIEKIRKYDPSYIMVLNSNSDEMDSDEIKESGGCYVATAVYGSYDCPEVWTLRRYRDNQLSKTWYGRLFIHTYYAISPTLVKWFGNTQWFKNMWKPKLDKMVDRLQKDGMENTPYQDRNW